MLFAHGVCFINVLSKTYTLTVTTGLPCQPERAAQAPPIGIKFIHVRNRPVGTGSGVEKGGGLVPVLAASLRLS